MGIQSPVGGDTVRSGDLDAVGRYRGTRDSGEKGDERYIYRCDHSSERPGMGHEKEFEVFPRPAHAVLHTGLMYCSEEFV